MNRGNQARTAEQLQVAPVTLYRKLKSYGLLGKVRGDRGKATQG
jgi:DNA-binding NtrC family response regulator